MVVTKDLSKRRFVGKVFEKKNCQKSGLVQEDEIKPKVKNDLKRSLRASSKEL